MAQILDPLPPETSNRILCCYVNATSDIQVARICNIANWYFERVVFPGQRLFFEAFPEAQLEIHTGMMATAILADKISCNELQVHEGELYSPEAETETEASQSSQSDASTNSETEVSKTMAASA